MNILVETPQNSSIPIWRGEVCGETGEEKHSPAGRKIAFPIFSRGKILFTVLPFKSWPTLGSSPLATAMHQRPMLPITRRKRRASVRELLAGLAITVRSGAT
jgi:hypothetical protein